MCLCICINLYEREEKCGEIQPDINMDYLGEPGVGGDRWSGRAY